MSISTDNFNLTRPMSPVASVRFCLDGFVFIAGSVVLIPPPDIVVTLRGRRDTTITLKGRDDTIISLTGNITLQ